ncbi:MAG TPA: mannosyltransferase family protein, partial [Thermoleophilia bacterium]|nr:mannosyltransferase family protein [Thermoleophilia bacterium]
MQDASLDRSSTRPNAAAFAWLNDRLALAAVGVALASRLVIAAAAFGAAHLFSVHAVHPSLREPTLAETLSGTWGALLNPFAHYDGVWFLRAAVHGYREPMTPAFFPLYPIAVRLAGELAGHRYELAGLALSTLFFVVAAWVLYRLVAAEFGPRPAFLTVVFLSVFPASFFFQAVYSESLFLLLTVACFWCLRSER